MISLNTAQPSSMTSLDQKTPLHNMQTEKLPETCPWCVEIVQPQWSLELTQPTLLGFQAFSRTKSVKVVPGFLEPVYTADSVYWLNHLPTHV